MGRRLLFVGAVAAWLLTPIVSTGTEDWMEKGLDSLRRGRYEEAIGAYTKALEADPENPKAYNNRGFAWAAKGDHEKAVADYSKAIELDPAYDLALNNRGIAWHMAGRYEQAIVDYDRTLKINPRCADALCNRGAALVALGDCARAVQDYTRAVEVDPKLHEAYNQLAWTLATCPDPRYRDGPRAVELARRAVALHPSSNSYDTLAAAYAETGAYGDAVSAQKKAIALLQEEGSSNKASAYGKRLAAYQAKARDTTHQVRPGRTARGSAAERSGTYTVQVGAFLKKENAEELAARLTGKGYQARIQEFTDSAGKTWYLVRFGEYPTMGRAREHSASFTRKENMPSLARPSHKL